MIITVATWNLAQRSPHGPSGTTQIEALLARKADVILLTEVREDVEIDGYEIHRSALLDRPRKAMSWSAIAARKPLRPLESRHEGLCLAELPDLGITAACSVLPWRGAGVHWPDKQGHPHAVRFADSLDRQLQDLVMARPLLWGGDFNVALAGPESAGSLGARQHLSTALSQLGLDSLVRDCESLHPGYNTIDHLCVPTGWQSEVHRETPTTPEGKPASDHALYWATVTLPGSPAPSPLR